MHVRTDVRPVPGNVATSWGRAAQVKRDRDNGVVPRWQGWQARDAGVDAARPLGDRTVEGAS